MNDLGLILRRSFLLLVVVVVTERAEQVIFFDSQVQNVALVQSVDALRRHSFVRDDCDAVVVVSKTLIRLNRDLARDVQHFNIAVRHHDEAENSEFRWQLVT